MEYSDHRKVFPWTNRSLLATTAEAGSVTNPSREEVKCMRMHLLIASVTILALAVAPAMAAPGWLSLDGSLSGDWGVDWGLDGVPSNPAEWAPGPGVWFVPGDDVVTASNSGGEWYDIEALYLRLDKVDASTQYLSWALVTSYAGNEAHSPYNATRDTPYTGANGTTYPYRRNPVLALDFNTPDPEVPTWDWGLIMASNYDWTWDGSGDLASDFSFANSYGLTDTDEGGWDHWPSFGQTKSSFGTGGNLAAAPELWSVRSDGWRSGRPGVGFPEDPARLRPVDFDTRDTGNSQKSTTGSAVAVGSYTEGTSYSTIPTSMGGQVPGQSSWLQRSNWVWEGYIEFPVSEFDFDNINTVEVAYGMWCANNHTAGDHVYGANPPTPELSTWALLLATGALGGWVRRRRKD